MGRGRERMKFKLVSTIARLLTEIMDDWDCGRETDETTAYLVRVVALMLTGVVEEQEEALDARDT